MSHDRCQRFLVWRLFLCFCSIGVLVLESLVQPFTSNVCKFVGLGLFNQVQLEFYIRYLYFGTRSDIVPPMKSSPVKLPVTSFNFVSTQSTCLTVLFFISPVIELHIQISSSMPLVYMQVRMMIICLYCCCSTANLQHLFCVQLIKSAIIHILL